jgi:UBX domain-containing protein 1
MCTITLYQNGFIIDDGEFNDYTVPENGKFLSELKKGKIPPKLRQKYPNGKLSINLR